MYVQVCIHVYYSVTFFNKMHVNFLFWTFNGQSHFNAKLIGLYHPVSNDTVQFKRIVI